MRDRREGLAPEQVGILTHRGRRTPGLRREEVAFLADIGVKWYARLEAGDDVRPSAATLTGIAVALRLSGAELEYMLNLAGLRQPLTKPDFQAIPEPLRAFVTTARGIAVMVSDRILTPVLWNDLSDALASHTRFPTAVDRNLLVRSLGDAEYIECLGPDHEDWVFRAVGLLRRDCSSPSPSPYAAEVYERVKNDPLFQRAWERRVVTDQFSSERAVVRHHRVVGRLTVRAFELIAASGADYLVRIVCPADVETAEKFKWLKQLGATNAGKIAPPLGVCS